MSNVTSSLAGVWRRVRSAGVLPALPALLTLVIFGLALIFLARTLRDVSLVDVQSQLVQIGFFKFSLAVVLMACSYALIVCYDFLALRHVGFKLRWPQTAVIGFTASSIGHNVGFSVLSGGAIRYRGYTIAGMQPSQVAGVIVFCSLTYFLGGGVLLGITLLLEPAAIPRALGLPVSVFRLVGLATLAGIGLYLFWTLLPRAQLRWRDWRISPPSLRIGICQILLGAVDVMLAAMVMFLLMPQSFEMAYLVFLGVYVMCLSVAVLSNVPAGIGVFEGSVLLLLPEVPPHELIGSLLAFRLVYFILPLLAGVAVLALQLGYENTIGKLRNAVADMPESGLAVAQANASQSDKAGKPDNAGKKETPTKQPKTP